MRPETCPNQRTTHKAHTLTKMQLQQQSVGRRAHGGGAPEPARTRAHSSAALLLCHAT